MKKKILIILLVITAVLAYCVNAQTNQNTNQNTELSGENAVHFIDVGQGDSVLVKSNGKYMLVDAGEEDKGSVVVNYLKKQGIKNIEYVVATHPHSDHIGGIDDVINNFKVSNIIMPDVSAGTRCFENMLDAVEKNNVKAIKSELGYTFELGDFKCSILGPVNISDDTNNNSVVMKLVLGNDSILLTGDCSRDEENDILNKSGDISADVIKIGHHGSSTSSSEEFIRKVDPKIAVISCGKDNEYGHPHKETLNTLNKYGVKVYRTDLDGSVIAKCSGNGITIESGGESVNIENGNEKINGAESANNEKITYILNTSSKKFHYTGCSGADSMSEKNKSVFTGSRNELINKGYSPCNICKP